MKMLRLTGMVLAGALSLSTAGIAAAQTVGQDMKDAGHDTAHATKTVAHKTAHGTKVAAKDTGHGTKVAAKDTAHGAKVGAKDTAHGRKGGGPQDGLGDQEGGTEDCGQARPVYASVSDRWSETSTVAHATVRAIQ